MTGLLPTNCETFRRIMKEGSRYGIHECISCNIVECEFNYHYLKEKENKRGEVYVNKNCK